MTEFQRQFYLLLCMSGRTEEAILYKEKIEKEEREHGQMGSGADVVENV